MEKKVDKNKQLGKDKKIKELKLEGVYKKVPESELLQKSDENVYTDLGGFIFPVKIIDPNEIRFL